MSEERLEEIIDAIAYLRDEYVDTEMVSEYYGHDIKAEIFSCPISALSYTGDYIELLQKRVQELESEIENWQKGRFLAVSTFVKEIDLKKQVQELEELVEGYKIELMIKDNAKKRANQQNKRYREAIRECIERMDEGGAGTRSFVYEKLIEALEGESNELG